MARKHSQEIKQARNKNSASRNAIKCGEIGVARPRVNAPTYLSLARIQKPFRQILKLCRRAVWTWPLSEKIKGHHVKGTRLEWKDRVEKWASLGSDLVVGPLPVEDLPKQWEDHMIALSLLVDSCDFEDACSQATLHGLGADSKKLRLSQKALLKMVLELARMEFPLRPSKRWSDQLWKAINKCAGVLDRLPVELFGDDRNFQFRSVEEARWRCAPGAILKFPKQKKLHTSRGSENHGDSSKRRMITRKEAWPSTQPLERLRSVVLRLNKLTIVPLETLYHWARERDWCDSQTVGQKNRKARKKEVLATLDDMRLLQ